MTLSDRAQASAFERPAPWKSEPTFRRGSAPAPIPGRVGVVTVASPAPRYTLQRDVSVTAIARYERAKRLLDLLLCITALPVVVPALAIIALAVRLDSPGPILFIQDRTGKGGRRFRIYKFRTMVENAENLKEHYAHLNRHTWPDFKISNDPRVTRVGRFLRRTSLDEFPQILNILRGHMSLVGPRPTSFSVDSYNLWHTERLEVPPGLTGLAQISGRAEVSDFDERLRLDIAYVRNRCLSLDLRILARTISAVLSGRGAI